MVICQLEIVSIIGFKFVTFFASRDDSRYFIIAYEGGFVSNCIQTQSFSFHKIIQTNIYWASEHTFTLGSKMFQKKSWPNFRSNFKN